MRTTYDRFLLLLQGDRQIPDVNAKRQDLKTNKAPSPLPRVVDIEQGIVMVVTDLHGDWPLYQRYRDIFLALRERGLANTLILTGDFIHSTTSSYEDRSLDIVLDLIQLREALGKRLLVLLGNHELPHLYHITLAKGDRVYTPSFEAAMGEHRKEIIHFFDTLPFYVRTRAGVSVCHAGAFSEVGNDGVAARLFTYSHQRVLHEVEAQLPAAHRPALHRRVSELLEVQYDILASHYLNVHHPDDPRYDDYLIGLVAGEHPRFELLWSAFFTDNEREHGVTYTTYVNKLLYALSKGWHRQRVLVAGHLPCRGGYRVLASGRQLRLASGAHAQPYESARYLLFDAGKAVEGARDLVAGLGSVFSN
jgi:hypothetical protein